MSGTLTAAVKAKATESPAEEGISGKKKKIRESKNRKKYWKKADVTEVDEFLENQRFNERIGGDVSFKEDDQLFMVDRSTDEAGEKRFQKKRSDILKEPLKCHAILDQRSKVPVPYTKSRVKSTDERKSEVHLAKEREVIAQRLTQSKNTVEKKRAEKEERNKKTKCKTLNTQTEIFDLWNGQEEKAKVEKTESGCHLDVLEKPEGAEALTKDQLAYYGRMTRANRPKVPALRYKKPSKLPAVEVAKPGASYKPTREDHQELLFEAHNVEVGKLRKEQHLERVLTSLFPTEERARQIRVENKKEEAVGILYSDDDEEDEEHSGDSNDELSSGNPRVLAENRKTRVQRNRQKAHQERLKKTSLVKAKKKFESQFGRIGVYKKEMKKAAQITRKRMREREQKMLDAMYQPRHIGRHRFRPQDMEVKLTDEIPSSLRQLKPEGSVMVDRMKSFERRNLIEPRRKTMRKKMWTKKVYKRSYKKGFEDVLTTPKMDGVA